MTRPGEGPRYESAADLLGPGRRILLATTNRHKAEEVRQILAAYGVDVARAEGLPPVEEDGRTFAENAAKKARAAARHLGAPAMADDSGLEVAVLGGEPGVRSARYAGPGATDGDNNDLLVRRLEALGARDPEAAFVCHVAVAAPDGRILAQAEGRVAGVIRWPGRGGGGFGYDPLFHHPPSGRRLAEMTAEEKNALSHRGQAVRAIGEALAALRRP